MVNCEYWFIYYGLEEDSKSIEKSIWEMKIIFSDLIKWLKNETIQYREMEMVWEYISDWGSSLDLKWE